MKKVVVILRRRWVAAAGLFAVTAAIFAVVMYPAAVTVGSTQRQLPIYSVQCENDRCAISFDAAWGNDATQKIIDTLALYHVKTTFFVIGDWAEKYPETVKAIHDAGHEVMTHSAHHDHYNALSHDEIVRDIQASCQVIESITGVYPTLIRCPYGEYDDHVISAVRSLGMEPIQWSVDSLDWKDLSASQITERVTKRMESGSIVLFHNAGLHTPEALPDIISYAVQQGLTIVPISELVLDGDYTIDHTGKQCPKM